MLITNKWERSPEYERRTKLIAIVITSQQPWPLVTLYMIPCSQVPPSLSFLILSLVVSKVMSSSWSFCLTNPTKNKMPGDYLAQLQIRKRLRKTNLKYVCTVQFSSVAQSCPTLCVPMNRSTPGLPVHHQLPESTQTQVHWVGDAIQPSHPLSSPSPPALNLSQHQGLFKWVSSSHVCTILD